MEKEKSKFVKYQSGLRENIFVEAHSLHNYINFIDAIKNVLDGALDMHYMRDLILESIITKTKDGYKKIDPSNYEAFFYKVPQEERYMYYDADKCIGIKIKFKNKQEYDINVEMFKWLFSFSKNDKTLEIILQNLTPVNANRLYDLYLPDEGYETVTKMSYSQQEEEFCMQAGIPH